MAKTIAEWRQTLASMDTDKLVCIQAGLKELRLMPEFEKEWGWTGIFTLGIELEDELRERGVTFERIYS